MTDNAPAFAPDFAHDAAAVREATDRLLVSVGKLDDEAIGEPSLLPDWTRGHLLAHLARNADALVNLLTWARTGVRTPMYASAAARDADIAAGADRPLAAHLEDLRTSADRFDAAAAALTADRWPYEVEMRNGVIERAARLPFRRLAEAELHHIDLGVGYSVKQLPGSFLDAELDFLTTVKFAGHPQVPALELRAENGRRWHTGRAGGTAGSNGTEAAAGAAPVVVTGTPAALVGWLTGRSAGGGLTTEGGPLPAVPPL
ncbi:maleylpyruvate isomerase family mycothiol-dependent enzyme [Streptomyces sp. MST-110588]|uniref:maleylpyruvate isomerase family mycothiol-dependent enzyme n=1 Tax=Streptomyces sp. MST-110588 TaxID=2833628 RepID=UPI001F5DDA07|nr:maleylpyruvate isomerase family mycothiol-dependent enzyme [Streptomyces sp. MST-110588]UNO42691.1 maleylpyruvate isomerase family mycothiol-dependent enzyme [Streptomyces sp. MST-110588]